MNNVENTVAQHYGASDLLRRILAGLEAAGADLNRLRTEDLSPVDEFHIGGRKATVHAVSKMPLSAGSHVLDIGCGLGGACRYIANETGCKVTGIDLTPDYISIAETLTNLTGFRDRVTFEVASALSMPFDAETFDAAISFHVAMNIHDRAALYTETARVMKPGATLCIYDVMMKNGEDLTYPVPWAATAATSHLTTPDEMRVLLTDAGFAVTETEDRTGFALEFFKQTLASASTEDGPPPLGIHLLMGPSTPEKIKNARNGIESGRIAPVQMIAVRN